MMCIATLHLCHLQFPRTSRPVQCSGLLSVAWSLPLCPLVTPLPRDAVSSWFCGASTTHGTLCYRLRASEVPKLMHLGVSPQPHTQPFDHHVALSHQKLASVPGGLLGRPTAHSTSSIHSRIALYPPLSPLAFRRNYCIEVETKNAPDRERRAATDTYLRQVRPVLAEWLGT